METSDAEPLVKLSSEVTGEKQKPDNNADEVQQPHSSGVKCKWENTGMCKLRSKCKDVHPSTTCPAHSKLGSCPAPAACQHRHPVGICREWERYGAEDT